MQLEWFFSRERKEQVEGDWLFVGAQRVRLCFVRNRRARRYVLRLKPDGVARLTVPRGGSVGEARRFAERQTAWLQKQLLRQATMPVRSSEWLLGTEIYFRGQLVRLELSAPGEVRFGTETISVPDAAADMRPGVERHLRQLAARELPPLVLAFAAKHQLQVNRVIVRNQRSRWGSCSRKGQVSLNWRLVQAP